MDNLEQIKKSAEELIDELFMEEAHEEQDVVEKAKEDVTQDLIDGKKSKEKPEDCGAKVTLADEVKPPKPKKDDEEGRPEQISDVPDVDEDGSRAKGYESVQKPNSKTPEVSDKGTVVKAFEVSAEDFELLQKAKAEKTEQELKKAKQEQEELIKAEIKAQTESLTNQVEELKKALEDSQKLLKAVAKVPSAPKSITSVAALEKSFTNADDEPVAKSWSKADILDACEELCKAEKISVEDVIEFENLGTLNNQAKREVEKFLAKKG